MNHPSESELAAAVRLCKLISTDALGKFLRTHPAALKCSFDLTEARVAEWEAFVTLLCIEHDPDPRLAEMRAWWRIESPRRTKRRKELLGLFQLEIAGFDQFPIDEADSTIKTPDLDSAETAAMQASDGCFAAFENEDFPLMFQHVETFESCRRNVEAALDSCRLKYRDLLPGCSV